MNRWFAVTGVAVGLLFGGGLLTSVSAQQEPGQVLIGIYQVAPGKHAEFLQWQAAQAAVAKEAGAPATQWYAHQDGDSWDYISIEPQDRDAAKQAALDDKIESLGKQKGRPTGFAAGLQFRQYIAFHTDTRAAGPLTIEQLSGMASGR